ncbi:MAG: hypothetical protein ABID54_10095 [Pseudomonadota bacterium]
MNRWIKYTILFLVVFKILFSGVLLHKDDRDSRVDSALTVASAEEKVNVTPAEVQKDANSDRIRDKSFSEQDIAILTSLENKRVELSKKEEQLGMEEERLNKLKQEIERKMVELKNIEAKLEKLIGTQQDAEAKRLEHLAKVYEATPPEQAGPMIAKLDVKLAADILMRINGRKAGKLWAFVDPAQAVKISEELAKRK